MSSRNVSFYQAKDPAIERKRRLAQSLMGQGRQPEGTEVVSGYAVKQSPVAALAKALATGWGGYEEGSADKLEQKSQTDTDETWKRALSAMSGQSQLKNGENVNWNQTGDPQKLYAEILMSNPNTAPYGIDSMMGQIGDEQQLDQTQKLENIRNQMTPYQKESLALEREKMARALQGQPQAPAVPQSAPPEPFGPAQQRPVAPPVTPQPKMEAAGPASPPIQAQPEPQPVAPITAPTAENASEFGPPTPQGFVTGDKFLETLDPSYARIVKAVGDGRAPFPTGSRMNAEAKKLVQDALQYNPKASANNIKNTLKFDTGKQGDQLRSFSVAYSHLDTLAGLAEALGNGDIKAFNKLGQSWASQTGSPAPTNFDTAKQLVADEIVKAVVGAGGGQGDREEAQRVINNANSPEQLKGAIDTYKELIKGQIGGFKQQYENSTGKDDFFERLSPEVSADFKETGPHRISSDEEYDALPSGAEFVDPEGKKRRKP